MPWEKTMDQRIRAVLDVLEKGLSKVSVCEDFGISRPTLDKWLNRFELEGVEGLHDRSRAPHRHPNARNIRILRAESPIHHCVHRSPARPNFPRSGSKLAMTKKTLCER